MIKYEANLEWARAMDAQDPLREYRNRFHLPQQKNGEPYIYMCGNSLGLQPKQTEEYVQQELDDWKKWGVEGHVHARNPWMPYHEFLTKQMAEVVGGQESEVVVMNTLTVNLHLMMVSFYRPEGKRTKIIIESDAFPSDLYAVESQVAFHKLDPQQEVVKLFPREGEFTLRDEDVLSKIREVGDELALVMIGGVNYYTGQVFQMREIAKVSHEVGAMVGFDLAHGAGNIELNLHDWDVDFAVWCTYKYLNSGPGSIAGCFVHQRHGAVADIPRFEGWWGHDKETRFYMRDDFKAIEGAEGWQLSNPPILSLAAVRSSLGLFAEVGIPALVEKSKKLSGYLSFLLDGLGEDKVRVITPNEQASKGCQLSIQVVNADKRLYDEVTNKGVIADWREPDVIRVAPAPFYNSFEDVFKMYEVMSLMYLGNSQ